MTLPDQTASKAEHYNNLWQASRIEYQMVNFASVEHSSLCQTRQRAQNHQLRSNDDHVIHISNITKRFHSLVALRDVTMRIPRGEVLGVLGPNGAGKTTLFKLVAGFLFPDEGHISATTRTWPTIGYKPERLLFPNHLRVRQYLEMVAQLSNVSGQKSRRLVGASLERVALGYAAEKRIKDCSKGMRQRLGLAQAMIGDPPLLLLDEPSSGLDPEGQAEICRQIKALHASGKTIVLASHQLNEVTQVCTHLIILNQGTIHYENRMANALTMRPHTSVQVTQDLGQLRGLLTGLSAELQVGEREVILSNEAISLRPQVLRILLAAGYDITKVDQSRVTLAEIYAEAVR